MTRTAMTVFCLSLVLLGSDALAKRITTGEMEQMQARVQSRLNAYHRFELAEREALEEGSKERAAAFGEAKQKAYQEYIEENAKYQKLQMDKREQDKRVDALAQPPR